MWKYYSDRKWAAGVLKLLSAIVQCIHCFQAHCIWLTSGLEYGIKVAIW